MSGSVSYVVTVYNKANYLEAVLAAIAAEREQTGGEIVLVDDGSTDSSADILARFVANNNHARVLPQPNRGVAAATNRGIAAAGCTYIRLVDADDVVVAGSTRRLVEALVRTGCEFCYGRMAHTPDGQSGTLRKDRTLSDPLATMLRHQPFTPSMSLGTATAMKAVVPLPEDCRTSQDFSLGVKLANVTCFVEVDALCCIVPENSGGLSASKALMFRDTARLSIRFAEELKWARKYRRAALQRGAGRARNYFRRHAPTEKARIAAFSLMAVLLKLRIPFPYSRSMSYIATSYDAVLSMPAGSA